MSQNIEGVCRYYTYIYYDPSRNNDPFYAGKGRNDRAWAHFYRTGKHPFVQRLQYMKKHNIQPIIGLYGDLDEDTALSLEMWFIYKFGRKDVKLGTLLNLSDGGEGSTNHIVTQEIKDKISESKKGKLSKNIGKKRTQAQKDKMSEAHKGHKDSDETKKKKSKKRTKSLTRGKSVSDAKSGKKRGAFSEEWKAKMSESHKLRWAKIKENKGISDDA